MVAAAEAYALASAILLLATGLVAEHLAHATAAADAAYLAALVIGGFYTAKAVVISLLARRVTISTLLLAVGAVVLGLYEQAAVLAVVFSLGQVLEEYASGRVRELAARPDGPRPAGCASRLGEDGALCTAVPVEGPGPRGRHHGPARCNGYPPMEMVSRGHVRRGPEPGHR